MSFNPPQFPGADETYQYGNIIWQFDGTAGVWNIVDGSLVGEQGPPGPVGPQGPQGEKGNTGSPATGDNASIIVSNGFITARLGAVGTTGVLGVSNRFSVVNGIAHPLPASNGASGIASFDSTYFSVSGTGHVSLVGSLNSGVTSFNGLTGAVTLTGDGGAIIGAGNNTIRARIADASATGVASFPATFFSVSNGAVSLSGPYGAIGVTGIGVGNSDPGITGRVTLTASGIVTMTRTGSLITIGGEANSGAAITASAQQVLFSSGNGGTGSDNFVFNGLAATFGGANTQFTITGPTFNVGNNTVVRGGIFYDAAESAPYYPFGNSPVLIKASDGSVQRVRIDPTSLPTYSVGFDESVVPGNWTNTFGVAESVVVILQCANGKTGGFAEGILTPSPTPILGGVTGGIDVFTLMRIPYSGGSLKMAFPIARGMTGIAQSIGTS